MKIREYKIYLDSEGLGYTTVQLTENDLWEYVATKIAMQLLPDRKTYAVELENERIL